MELKTLLKQNNISIWRLAKDSGIAYKNCLAIVKGKQNPSLKTILAFSNIGIIATAKQGKIIWNLEIKNKYEKNTTKTK